MSVHTSIRPTMFVWARERSKQAYEDLARKFPNLGAWEQGTMQPTLDELEAFAKATHTPVGYLFLTEPPDEPLLIHDGRTVTDQANARPSPDLRETVYLCRQRQEWYRNYARVHRAAPVPFAGALTVGSDVKEAANRMREIMGFAPHERRGSPTRVFTQLIDAASNNGVLVMIDDIVGDDTQRRLDPSEFRGFALADDLAPLIFINGASTQTAKMFTLAHELVHIGLGHSALSDADVTSPALDGIERWCDRVADEFLVPADSLRKLRVEQANAVALADALAQHFKVSSLVVLRRLFATGYLTLEEYREALTTEQQHAKARVEPLDDMSVDDSVTRFVGRVSERFARALVESTLAGETLYRDAFRMLGINSTSAFDALAATLASDTSTDRRAGGI